MKLQFHCLTIVAIMLVGSLGCVAAEKNDFLTESRVFTTIPAGQELTYVGSYDGHHFYYFVKEGQQHYAIINGKKGPSFDNIESIQSSRESLSVAYEGRRGNRLFAVLNNKPGPAFVNISELTFSPDGNHLAYRAKAGKVDRIVVDQKEGPSFYAAFTLTFSPDSKHFAYVAIEHGSGAFVVLDGKKGPAVPGANVLQFSPDSEHLAYPFIKTGRVVTQDIDRKTSMTMIIPVMQVMLDNHPLPFEYHGHITNIVFSPEKQLLTYVVEQGGEVFVVQHGERLKGPPADRISNLTYSADGKRLVYCARSKKNNDWFVVVDGKKVATYDFVQLPDFSLDGKHLVFNVRSNDKEFVVLDGKKGPLFDQVVVPIFTSDGQHLAYRARRGNKWYVVLDGVLSAPFDYVSGVNFSPDDKYLGTAVLKGRELRWEVMPVK